VRLAGALFLAARCFPSAPAFADAPEIVRLTPADEASIAELAISLENCSASLSAAERWRMASIIHRESREQGYDPLFVVALILVESGCSRSVTGPGGGVGLTQIQPATARQAARDASIPWRGAAALTRPAVNIELGVVYLAQLEDRFNDPLIAMAAYNMGPGRVARMSRRRARGASYVRRVLDRYEALAQR
jgi:soluble lytic murein transglycosylase-like protein